MSPDGSARIAPVPYAELDDPLTLNLYGYVFNNLMTRVDADGHDCTGFCKTMNDAWNTLHGKISPAQMPTSAPKPPGVPSSGTAQQPSGRQPDGSYIAPTGPGSDIYNRTHGGKDDQVLHPPDDTKGECVTACKYFSGITASTTAWKEGAAVSGNDSIPIGTAIATFGSNGKYPTDGDQNSGIYMGPGSKPGSIRIFDQWPAYGAPLNTPANPPSIRQMRFNSNNGHSLANSASAYHVIIAP